MKKNQMRNTLIRILLLITICTLCILAGTRLPGVSYKTESAQVLYVIDGDTLDVLINGKKERVRLLGVDAPEMGFEGKKEMCFARESRDFLETLIGDQSVFLESDISQSDRDSYNRMLRYLYLPDKTCINKRIIEKGYAREYTFQALPYRFQKEFQQAEYDAKNARVGLWQEGTCP